ECEPENSCRRSEAAVRQPVPQARVERAAAAKRHAMVQRASLVERQQDVDASARLDERRHAGVRVARDRPAMLDGPEPATRQGPLVSPNHASFVMLTMKLAPRDTNALNSSGKMTS